MGSIPMSGLVRFLNSCHRYILGVRHRHVSSGYINMVVEEYCLTKELEFEDGVLVYTTYEAEGMGTDPDKTVSLLANTIDQWQRMGAEGCSRNSTYENNRIYTNRNTSEILVSDEHKNEGDPRSVILRRGLTEGELEELALELSKKKVFFKMVF